MTSLLVTSARYVTNVLCRRRRTRSTLLVVAGCALAVFLLTGGFRAFRDPEVSRDVDEVDWDLEYEKAREQSLREHIDFYVADAGNLQPVPAEWTARDRCPACFGTDMCEAVDSGDLRVTVAETPTAANRKGVYQGRWKDVPVVVKRLVDWYPPEFKLFDEFICMNATLSKVCNVSEAIVRSNCWVQNNNAFTVEHLLQAWKISYAKTGPLALMYALCLTNDVVQQFSRLYSINSSNVSQMNPTEKAMFYTSMVVQPESLMLKFLKNLHSDRLAPRVYGACGRLVVVEHGGRLLETYLNTSFSQRAELALQLISLMKMLWHADQRWFALYNDVQYENIAVTHYGQVYLIDYEHLSIIQNVNTETLNDNKDSKDDGVADGFHDDEHQLDDIAQCNSDCFERLFSSLSNEQLTPSARQNQCKVLHDVSLAFMYSALCQNILSDGPPTAHRGLLHSIPDDDDLKERRKSFEDSLHECINESKAGGRLDAIDNLSEILSVYTGLRLE